MTRTISSWGRIQREVPEVQTELAETLPGTEGDGCDWAAGRAVTGPADAQPILTGSCIRRLARRSGLSYDPRVCRKSSLIDQDEPRARSRSHPFRP